MTTRAVYKTPSEKAAKRLYKSCVEHHTFFRYKIFFRPVSTVCTLAICKTPIFLLLFFFVFCYCLNFKSYCQYVQQNSVRSFLPHTTLPILLQTQSCLFCVRLTFSDPPPSRSSSLLRMGSKFRYSDRTLYQLHKDGQPIKDQPKFKRVSSLNWSRRYQMPSLSETRIYVKEDDESNKRPLSEGDLPGKMRWYKGGQVS